MSAASGIGISQELSDTFTSAADDSNIRFIRVSVRNESLVPKGTTPAQGASLEDDLERLQSLLEDNVPEYILARIGGPKELGWLAISYVPDTATVRDKMLYASSRSALTKGLGSTHFPDSLFATSKEDLTSKAYAAHKAHNTAPQPLSAREQEIADARAAERSSGAAYEGSNARRNHVGAVVGMKWNDDAEKAVKELGEGSDSSLVVLSIDTTETLELSSASQCGVEDLAGRIPSSEPSFALYAWRYNLGSPSPRRDIVFIYSCPSASSVKYRMIYSSQARALYHVANSILSSCSPPAALAARKIETSDPTELTEAFLLSEFGLNPDESKSTTADAGGITRIGGTERGFARPKGPGRKR